jgi:hypothetical protein
MAQRLAPVFAKAALLLPGSSQSIIPSSSSSLVERMNQLPSRPPMIAINRHHDEKVDERKMERIGERRMVRGRRRKNDDGDHDDNSNDNDIADDKKKQKKNDIDGGLKESKKEDKRKIRSLFNIIHHSSLHRLPLR